MQQAKTKVKPTIKQVSKNKFSLAVLLASKHPIERQKIIQKIIKKGVGYHTINRIKNCQVGEKYEPLFSNMQVIADVMNISIDNLLTQD